MTEHSKLSSGLREDLLSLLDGSYTHRQLNHVVAVSHALARAFLSSKSSIGSLSSKQGLSVSDLAYDSIAELFQQDSEESFRQLYSYFCGLPIQTAQDEEILAFLRRLVFSKVNHGVSRLLSECDPSLAKILRNIKLGVHALKNFEEVERFGEPCLVPSMCDVLEPLPSFEREELELVLLEETTGEEMIPEMLGKLSLFLREQHERSRIIPLVMAGLVIRAAYERKLTLTGTDGSLENVMLPGDVTSVISSSCEKVKKLMAGKYIKKGKVSCEMMETYFQVIQEELRNRFLGMDGHDGSLYEIFRKHCPELTKKEYSSHHRNQIEYLLKLVNKKAIEELKS